MADVASGGSALICPPLGRLVLCFVLAGWAPAHGQERGKPPPEVRRSEDDLLIFELRLDQVILSDSFPGYPTGDGFLLPLGELCRELDLGIQVDPARGLAEGFLIEERRGFRLDAATGALTVGGTTQVLDRTRLEVRPDDLYLDTRLLSQCLPVDLTVSKRLLVVTLKARGQLPLQARWQREGGGGRPVAGAAPKVYGAFPDPYRLWEVPAVDATLGLQRSQPQGGGRALTTQGSLLAAGDLLYFSTSLYALAQDPGGLTNFHLTAGRSDPHSGLLGPLHASAYSFGEVLSSGVNLLASPSTATGLRLTNQPLQAGNAFDRHSFQGDLPPGWQVELYQNQGLVAFQASRPDGRYEFLNVPLGFGVNTFRLIFYGPQGQRRDETVTFDVSQNQTPAGVFHYELTASEPRDAVGRRTEFNGAYGLTPQLTALAGAARVDLLGVTHDYTEVGLQGFWKPLSGSLTAGRDSRGGSIAELALRTRLGPFSLVGKETELRDGFQSEVFQVTDGAIRSRTSLELSGALPSATRPWVTLDFQGYRDQVATGGYADHLNFHLGTTLFGAFLSNQFSRTDGHGLAAPVPATSTGTFLASKVLPGFDLRGEADYTLSEGRKLTALALTTDLTPFDPYALTAGLTHTVSGRDTALDLGVIRTQGTFGFGASLAYSDRTRLSASVSLRVGLAREPREHRLFTKAQGAAGFGAVSAEAFLDGNGNGVRDPGEKPLANVGFLVNGAAHPSLTDAKGVAFLDGLPQDVDANLAPNPTTLEDPLMRPAVPGARFTPRAGHVTRLEAPIVLFSEITGTTFRVQGGLRTELPGLRLELVDASGKVLKSVRSAFDGFYSFGDLPPGDYTLEVAEASAQRLGAPAPPPRKVHLAPEGTVLDGVDFILEGTRREGEQGGQNK